MKFIIPNFCYTDSFVDNVTFTLRAMGHEVLNAPLPKLFRSEKEQYFLNLIKSKLSGNHRTPQLKWLSKVVREEKFDVLLCLTQVIDEEILLECKKKGVRTIAWWGDTAANMTRHGLLCNGWDHIFIKDRYAAFKLKTLGLDASYLAEAMNPHWHNKFASSFNDHIVFAGNAYDYRHFLIRKLVENGFSERIKLYGGGVPSWAAPEVEKVFQHKYIVKEEKSKVFGEASVCINSTAMSEGNSLNCRAFEICGAWGLQIFEYREALHESFEVGKEILAYENMEQLVELIQKYQSVNDSKEIREAGYRRAHSEHTYQNRIDYMLKIIS